MKKTALYSAHQALGAKIVPFAGYEMPVQYEGVTVEHETVRNHVGVFDVSHMGEFLIEGEEALQLIQKISSNDASKLSIGKAQYSCMPNNSGGIIDDLIIYRIKDNTYLLVVNASNIEKDWNWIESQNTFKASMRNLSDEYALLAIQGPKAIESMQSLTSINLAEIPYYSFKIGDFADLEHVIISATGYTGSGGFEIYCKSNEVETLWAKILDAGEAYGIKPIGLAARDTLRLEMGYCLYGNDINDYTSPIEASLGWITKFTKPFVNSEALEQQKLNGISRKLVGFELKERGIPRQGYPILDSEGATIGEVTSGTMSPSLGKGIGLGYVKIENSTVESKLLIQIRKKQIEAVVVKLPFYKNN